MKLVKTVVRANKIDEVREALDRFDIASMTVTEAPGWKAGSAARHGSYLPVFATASIELVVRDEIVADVIATITRAARREDIGDGHVSVVPLDHDGYLLA